MSRTHDWPAQLAAISLPSKGYCLRIPSTLISRIRRSEALSCLHAKSAIFSGSWDWLCHISSSSSPSQASSTPSCYTKDTISLHKQFPSDFRSFSISQSRTDSGEPHLRRRLLEGALNEPERTHLRNGRVLLRHCQHQEKQQPRILPARLATYSKRYVLQQNDHRFLREISGSLTT